MLFRSVAALAYLSPAATTGSAFGTISLTAQSETGQFTATLTGGGSLDMSGFVADQAVVKNIAIQ